MVFVKQAKTCFWSDVALWVLRSCVWCIQKFIIFMAAELRAILTVCHTEPFLTAIQSHNWPALPVQRAERLKKEKRKNLDKLNSQNVVPLLFWILCATMQAGQLNCFEVQIEQRFKNASMKCWFLAANLLLCQFKVHAFCCCQFKARLFCHPMSITQLVSTAPHS